MSKRVTEKVIGASCVSGGMSLNYISEESPKRIIPKSKNLYVNKKDSSSSSRAIGGYDAFNVVSSADRRVSYYKDCLKDNCQGCLVCDGCTNCNNKGCCRCFLEECPPDLQTFCAECYDADDPIEEEEDY